MRTHDYGRRVFLYLDPVRPWFKRDGSIGEETWVYEWISIEDFKSYIGQLKAAGRLCLDFICRVGEDTVFSFHNSPYQPWALEVRNIIDSTFVDLDGA